jgi:putative hydrolase of the HAD superfamily
MAMEVCVVFAGPKAVLWDFDGTLAWRVGRWSDCLVEALDLVHENHGVTRDAVRPGLQGGFPWHRPHEGHRHLDTAHRWWSALLVVVVEAYRRVGVDPDVARAAADLVPGVYVDPQYWRVFADTRPALTRLRAAGWRHVIVSNHVPELPGLVRGLGLDDLVDLVVTSAASGYEKPHPEMFAFALAQAGSPERVWMVGDNRVADLGGATAVGIPALLVRTPAAEGAQAMDLQAAATLIIDADGGDHASQDMADHP